MAGQIPWTPPAPGQQLTTSAGNNYFVGQVIGEGGFGLVYHAHDDWGNALVLKVLKPTATFDVVRGKWEDEIAKLNMMRHPNITYIHDWFIYRGVTFCLMIERCDFSLKDLPLDQRTSMLGIIARDVLQGLSFIHRQDYVHKDMHAGNILLHRKRCPLTGQTALSFQISDLGISNLEGDIGQGITVMAQWMMPPERLSPEFGPISKQTDLYHFALVLLEGLVMRPLNFTTQEILEGAPRVLAESLASPVAQVLAKCLRRRVDARPDSALAMWRELESAGLRGRQV
jgi:serine/threonine protein kinase